MNLFQAMQSRKKTREVDSDRLPDVNSFIDVATGGRTEYLPIESIGSASIVVRRPAKAVVGTSALFNYSNRVGRFRFYANCTQLTEKMATFDLPISITVIEQFGNKRRNVRLKTALPVTWRYAPDGSGYGNFYDGNSVDISCVGMSLLVPRELRAGTQVEIRFDLSDGQKPFTVIGTLTRPTQPAARGRFSAGMSFKNIRPTEENRLAEFILARQRGQRKRALAE